MDRGEGERLHAQQRMRFWAISGAIAIVAAIGGLIIEQWQPGGGDLPPALGTAGIAVVALALAYGSWRFFATVDELELADNLWGSLVAFYTYAILFPAWWGVARIGQAPEPDQWAIYAITLAAGGGAYIFRKWRAR